jgi:uncharacterized protein (TIGR03083 family)
MGERIDALTARLAEKGEETAAFFRSLGPEDWEAQIYTEGQGWTVRQVLCHFVSTERAFARLLEEIPAGGTGVPEGLDVDAFNAAQVARLDGIAPDALIEQFEAARAAMIALLRGFDEADLDRQAHHPWLGFDRVEKFVKLVYRHNMIHQRDVRRALGGSQS